MNAINNYSAMKTMLETLDTNIHKVWFDFALDIYHITWWNKKENITIHFYYDKDGSPLS